MNPIVITVLLYSLTVALGIVLGIKIGFVTVYKKEILPRDTNPEKFYEIRFSSSYVPFIVKRPKPQKELK